MELLVAVDPNLLRTMASETVDPIDWSHSPPSWAVPPERLVHNINWCIRSSTGNRTCNFSMRGNHLAYAATQAIRGNAPLKMSLISRAEPCFPVGLICSFFLSPTIFSFSSFHEVFGLISVFSLSPALSLLTLF